MSSDEDNDVTKWFTFVAIFVLVACFTLVGLLILIRKLGG